MSWHLARAQRKFALQIVEKAVAFAFAQRSCFCSVWKARESVRSPFALRPAGCLVAICAHSMNVGISHCKSLSQVGENAPVRLDRVLIFLVPIDQDPVSSIAGFHLILLEVALCSLYNPQFPSISSLTNFLK